MRKLIALLPLVLVFGCSKDEIDFPEDTDGIDTDDGDGDTDDTQVEECTAEIAQILPLDGSLGVGVNEDLEVWFTAPVGDVSVTLATSTGTEVTAEATVADDGLSAIVTHAELAESTEYVVTIDVCQTSGQASFTTTAGPVDETIEHVVYALDYREVEWRAPAWAEIFRERIPLEYVLVEILDFDDALQELDAAGAMGFEDENGVIQQGACYDPMLYDDVDFSDNPRFEIGPDDIDFPSQNFTVYNLRIAAAFDDGRDSLVGIDVTGQIDGRQVEANVGIDPCVFAEANGDSCVACEHDGAEECMNLWLTADEAPSVPGLDIDEAYVAADDPQCP